MANEDPDSIPEQIRQNRPFFMVLGLGLGTRAVSAPIAAEAPLPVAVGVALLLASFLYGEFTLPSYKRT